ncbi:MlaE family ABC transporter permease [Pelomicrobium sp.]|uniref:MlaE family ABC transporter permease n=1 Tax=Pelomicrobium sp. TaxID=2815319 RepID=UPI002FDD05D8
MTDGSPWLRLEPGEGGATLYLMGLWRLPQLSRIALALDQVAAVPLTALDGSRLEALDTSGAAVIYRFLTARGLDWGAIELKRFAPQHLSVMTLVSERLRQSAACPPTTHLGPVAKVGRAALELFENVRGMTAFLGQVAVELVRVAVKPRAFRLREMVSHLETVGVDAIPIVAMVTFLIGVVFAYLLGIVIERFGVNIFVVDGVGLAMCRELSPLIVAIILAGRTGASFCAQLGTMKVTEEIDAIRTLGLSPIQLLVIPRLVALVVALPLLTFLGDVMGILGGMLIADLRLSITVPTFLDRLQSVLAVRHVWVGLAKAPVFALVIALIGCRMGMAVKRDARSVGAATTATVVQCIVSVILLDAGFAVLFVELGI